MGLEMVSAESLAKRQAEALLRGRHIVQGRWAVTPAGEVIPEDQATVDGCSLLYRHGDEIPVDEARRAGFDVSVAVVPQSFTVEGHWVVTPEGQTVPEDQAYSGGQLLYRDGDVISLEEARQAGFLRGEKKELPKPPDKSIRPPATKPVRKPATKAVRKPATKARRKKNVNKATAAAGA